MASISRKHPRSICYGPGPRLGAEHWRRDRSGPVLQGSSSSRRPDPLPRRSQREPTAARETQGEGRLRRPTAPPPISRGYPYHHRLLCLRRSAPPTPSPSASSLRPAASALSAGHQRLPTRGRGPLTRSRGPLTRGRGTVGETRCWQRGSERGLCGWDRWRSRFNPPGVWSLWSTGTHHPPHSLCAPGPGRPQARGLALPSLL